MRIPSDLMHFVPVTPRSFNAFCVLGRFANDWMVVDADGRIVTSGDLMHCAQVANQDKLPVELARMPESPSEKLAHKRKKRTKR